RLRAVALALGVALCCSAAATSAQTPGQPVYFVAHWGLSTDIPVPADYSGDGASEVAIFRPSEGNWYVLESQGGPCEVTGLTSP
ncbi:MAG TPA: hypothetical protein VEQ42_04630, partial [Pyrinomonadaceae bacterium]|nr:hypothetical protein [Pyrinomonadaceae bacterium]